MTVYRIPEVKLIFSTGETAVIPDGGTVDGVSFCLNQQEQKPDWLTDCSDSSEAIVKCCVLSLRRHEA